VLTEAQAALEKKRELELAKVTAAAVKRYRTQIERDPRDFVANPNGSVTVVEFFDYNCAYCKLIAPNVVELIKDNPDIRFVFKEYAFQTNWSLAAAKLALTPAAKAHGVEFYDALMSQKPLDGEAIQRSLVAAGVDVAAARRGAEDPAIERQLIDTHQLVEALGIEGTPAFIVGDIIVPGADVNALKAAIASARSQQKKAAARSTT
jgi:protein-disulfide isomerase